MIICRKPLKTLSPKKRRKVLLKLCQLDPVPDFVAEIDQKHKEKVDTIYTALLDRSSENRVWRSFERQNDGVLRKVEFILFIFVDEKD